MRLNKVVFLSMHEQDRGETRLGKFNGTQFTRNPNKSRKLDRQLKISKDSRSKCDVLDIQPCFVDD
jgi:hypothetical protein